MLLIKILKHETVLKPFYIAMSNDLRFHALYDDVSVGMGHSLAAAIESIPNKNLYGLSSNALDWKHVIHESALSSSDT
jgi:CTP:molybdopterin cytidylyltransferase MocA